MSEKPTALDEGASLPDDERVDRVALAEARGTAIVPPHRPGKTLSNEARAMNASSYANYLFGSSGSGDRPAWSDSTGGRAAIRLVSRGLVGTAFFTVGGRYARRQLRDYHTDHNLWQFEKNAKTGEWQKAPPLQWLARGIDRTLGRGIQKTAELFADTRAGKTDLEKLRIRRNVAWDVTDFRQKSYYLTKPGQIFEHNYADGMKIYRPKNGRSYGAEVVGVTFDFAMASIGDALTRNFFQGIDPNVKHTWMVGKDGKPSTVGQGHFSPTKWVQSLGGTAWRILSKNQGEDWAAGLVYVYQMKYQRQMLNKIFKGSKLVFDNGWHGSAFKINNAGQVIGDYQLPGAIDLHMRFVGYNWYTLMFRESYDAIADRFQHWRKGDAPLIGHMPANPFKAALDTAGTAVKYVTKSFIKTNLYMNPAVIPFWLTRVPQAKWRGAFMRTDLGQLESAFGSTMSLDGYVNKYCASNPGTNRSQLRSDMLRYEPFSGAYDFNYSTDSGRYPTLMGEHLGRGKSLGTIYHGNRAIHNFEAGRPDLYSAKAYEHYETSTTRQRFEKRFSQAVNPLGKLCYTVGSKVTRFADRHFTKEYVAGGEPVNYGAEEKGLGARFNRFISWYPGVSGSGPQRPTNRGREYFVRQFVDASMSYTPYMWAKMETGLRVDEHKPNQRGAMDNAIYGLIDQTVALNPRGIVTSGRDIIRLAFHFDKPVKSREEVLPTEHAPEAIAEAPVTTVDAASIKAEGKSKPLPPAVNDNGHEANDNERGWAETVAGRHLGAAFQPPPATRH